MRDAAADTAASAVVAPSLKSRVSVVDRRGLPLLGFLLDRLFGGSRVGLHDALAEHRQRLRPSGRFRRRCAGRDFGGEIAAGQPRHGPLEARPAAQPDCGRYRARRTGRSQRRWPAAITSMTKVPKPIAASERSVASPGLVVDGLDLTRHFAGEFVGDAAGLAEQLLAGLLAVISLRRHRRSCWRPSPAPARLRPPCAGRRSAAACRRCRASPRHGPTIVLKSLFKRSDAVAFGATAARSSISEARLTRPRRSANPCDTGTCVDTRLSSVIVDCLASPPSVHRRPW